MKNIYYTKRAEIAGPNYFLNGKNSVTTACHTEEAARNWARIYHAGGFWRIKRMK